MKSPDPCLCLLFSSGALSRQDNLDSGKPWVPANHPGLRLLWWVLTQVWLSHRLEILHWDIRLLVPLCYHWWKGEIHCPVVPLSVDDNETACSKSSDAWQFGQLSEFLVYDMTSYEMYPMHSFLCPSDLLCAWWLISINPNTGPDPDHWQKTGSAPWWANVWPFVVRSWRYKGFLSSHLNIALVCMLRNV